MNNAGQEPTHRPKLETLRYISYLLGLQFHPPLKLSRTAGWDFTKSLASCIEPREAKIEDNVWQLSQPLGGGILQLVVQDQLITIQATNPTTPLEWFETRVPMILKGFRDRFLPKLLLTSAATAAAILDIEGDSRSFLTRDVMKMDKRRLAPLNRPIQLVGLRIAMPPYEIKNPPGKRKKAKVVSSADWVAEVKGESFGADPSKLFLEVSGQWPVASEWDEQATVTAVGRLNTVKEFLRTRLVPFLTAQREEGA
jgi:hypothetical protein